MHDSQRLDVVGIGSMVVDRLHRVPRLLGPDEKGIVRPLEGGQSERILAGGVVLNHLGWAAALGLSTGIFGKQADDAPGRFLRRAMDRLGIARNLILDGSATSVADIFVDDAGERAIYIVRGATAETSAAHIRDHHADFIRSAAQVTTEVSQLPLPAVLEVLRIARDASIPTLVDVDVPPSDAIPELGDRETLVAVLTEADVLKPSRAAARELVPEAADEALALARALRARFESEAVVVTDGDAGCAIAAEEFEGCIPARPAKALDGTGAGDAFLGGLLAARHAGLGWGDAARLANACGGACVEQFGAFPDDPAAARARALELYDGPPLSLGPAPQCEGPRATSSSGAQALAAFEVIAEELAALGARLDPAQFEAAVELIRLRQREGGRVHVTGIGKPEYVARYAAASLASTGTPATFLHGTEVAHGSAGQLVAGDVVIAISNSGETPELRRAVEHCQRSGARVIGVTGNAGSWLARNAELWLDARVEREGGLLGLAPRASIAAEIAVLGALGAALEHAHGFTSADYHARHPAGELGRRSRAGSTSRDEDASR